MKKIKITEAQAKLLGIKYITENELESGLKSVGTSIGEVIIRAVISGDNVPRLKDRIIQIVKRHDKDANINFFEVTNKIVGQIKEIKLSAIKRDLKDLDPTIIIENKPLTKNLVKITKEQYDRLVKSGLIKENSNIDDSFKKAFAGKNIENLKPVSEDNFNITNPNTSVPKLSKSIGNNELPVHENSGDDDLKKETLELLKYLYRKSETISPFWGEKGLSYDEICKVLLDKNLIVSKDGKYEVSKTSDNPELAKQAIENELRSMIKPENKEMVSEPELETEASDLPAGAEHDSNAPWNKKDDYSSPIKPKESKLEGLTLIENDYIAILEGPDGSRYAFNYYGVDKPNLGKYASLERTWVGKDEEGKDEYEYSDDFNVTPEVIANYVNDNLSSLDKGEGIDDYNDGVSLVKIDEPLKQKLLALYDKNKNINEFFGVSEDEDKTSHDIAKDKISSSLPISSSKPKTDPEILRNKIADLRAKELENRKKSDLEEIDFTKQGPKFNEGDYVKYIQGDLDIETWYGIITRIIDLDGDYAYRINSYHKDKNTGKIWDHTPKTNEKYEAVLRPSTGEFYNKLKSEYSLQLAETTSASSGAFTAPMGGADVVKREMPNTPVVGETTVAGAGNFQYDTPGLANVGRNGEFKKGPKTKAQSKTQYAGGSFVETSSCTKLNNNKEAQNGKCSQGAVDGVVKQKKTNGSIISPSLGENSIYESIAKKTGRTIDDIKIIINSKKNK